MTQFEDDARQRFRQRLERHRRRNETSLVVGWTDNAPWDSLRVRLRLQQVDAAVLTTVEELVVSWHRLGVLGGYCGVVHDAHILGLSSAEDGGSVYDVVLDLGSADELALDVFLRALRGVVISAGLALDEVMLGWD